ncbi:MAG TPA: Clp protease N-terminal domain-containing protein, partial [Fimbriimonadaceae bacterium]|nr:Clp protease N-terminal domain-containing protein [Fimbriimonadaceae bacterium]
VLAKLGVELEAARAALLEIRSGDTAPRMPARLLVPTPSLQGRFLHEHLILVMLADPEGRAYGAMAEQCDNLGGLQADLWLVIAFATTVNWYPPVGIEGLFARAQAEAAGALIQSEHLLLAITYDATSAAAQILKTYGINYARTKKLLQAS